MMTMVRLSTAPGLLRMLKVLVMPLATPMMLLMLIIIIVLILRMHILVETTWTASLLTTPIILIVELRIGSSSIL